MYNTIKICLCMVNVTVTFIHSDKQLKLKVARSCVEQRIIMVFLISIDP